MRTLLFFTLFLAAFVAEAQLTRGNFLISGGITGSRLRNTYDQTAYNSNTGQWINNKADYKLNSFSINPRAGFFITSRLCAGLSVPLSFSTNTVSVPGSLLNKSETNRYGIGPFVRYYQPLKGRFYALAELAFDWSWQRTNTFNLSLDQNGGMTRYEATYNNEPRNLTASAGFAYLLNNNIGLELLGTYRSRREDNVKYSAYWDFGIQLGFQIYLGK